MISNWEITDEIIYKLVIIMPEKMPDQSLFCFFFLTGKRWHPWCSRKARPQGESRVAQMSTDQTLICEETVLT